MPHEITFERSYLNDGVITCSYGEESGTLIPRDTPEFTHDSGVRKGGYWCVPLDLHEPNCGIVENNSLIHVSYVSRDRIEIWSKKGSEWWTSSDVYERVGSVEDD